MTILTDESVLPALDRFDEHARELYFELRLSGRTPIAMVGSGMSITYGGISWKKSVELALAEARRQLCSLKDLSGRNDLRVKRALGGIDSMIQCDLKESSDKYLALELCKEGIEIARSLADRAELKGYPSFHEFMQRIFISDDYFVATTIAERFSLTSKDEKELLNGNSEHIQLVAREIYSFNFLERASNANPTLADFLSKIRVKHGYDVASILPIDRRSSICIFLYEMTVKLRHKLYEEVIASNGMTALPHAPLRPLIDPIRVLYDRLGINRFITLNFDLEIENSIMIDDFRSIRGRGFGFGDALNEGLLQIEPGVGPVVTGAKRPDIQLADLGTVNTGGVTRRFSDGLAASSDIYNEAAVARLFEFALNSPDYRTQILHLHGRADVPETMVLTESDLDRVYRRNPRARTALEQALDVLLTGNPVLFVGIGLSEQEITRALRLLVSEGRVTPTNPAFAIQAFDRGGGEKGGGSDGWRRQMALFRQYGIHLIDAGHPRHGEDGGLPAQLSKLKKLEDALQGLKAAKAGSFADLKIAATACRNLSLVNTISLDAEVFEYLLDRLCERKPRVDQAGLALNYIEKLKEKLYSVCVEKELKRLAERTDHQFRRTSLSARDLPNDVDVSRFVDDQLDILVREASLQGAAPKGGARHGATIDPSAPTSSTIVDIAHRLVSPAPGVCCWLAPLGWGKGALARTIQERLTGAAQSLDDPETPYIVINCNFSLEFESAILQLLRFVSSQTALGTPQSPWKDRIGALIEAFKASLTSSSPAPTIVLTGIERLIDNRDKPLTPEFEVVLKVLLREPKVRTQWRVIILGTPECRKLLEDCGLLSAEVLSAEETEPFAESGFLAHLLSTVRTTSAYTSGAIRRDIDSIAYETRAAITPYSPRSNASKALLRLVLERWQDIAFDAELQSGMAPYEVRARAEFDKVVLTNLCFIGLPIEPSVLEHLPEIKRYAKFLNPTGRVDTRVLVQCRKRLTRFGLVLKLKKFQDKGQGRLVLHRIVLAELRDRYGVRSGEEMLSNSFCPTLAVSMPTDLAIADSDIHDQLKGAVGSLRGAWKDARLLGIFPKAFADLREAAELAEGASALLADNAWLNEKISRLERLVCMINLPMQARMRAAGGIIRGFFSAATLVGIIPEIEKRDDWRAGEFEEHKSRIARLLARMREAQRAASEAESIMRELEHNAEFGPKVGLLLEKIRDQIREAPSQKRPEWPAFYSGELIWLLNEQGTIALLQGDLHAAEQSFREAEAGLRRYKGWGARQSWRRLEINRTLLRIERGRIAEARLKLEAIKPKMNKALPEEFRASEEDRITLPLIAGYLGLCDFLGGHYERADQSFKGAIELLIATDQQRALALFYWRRGELLLNRGDQEEAADCLRLAIASAEAGRQIDAVWRARLSLTRLQREKESALAETVFNEAQRYAEVMDLPRIAVIALNKHAAHKLFFRDFKSAAALATQGMQLATNYGMVLNRISARTLMGTILLRSGDRSGEYLLRRSIAHADRIGYQLQVETAKNALLLSERLRLRS